MTNVFQFGRNYIFNKGWYPFLLLLYLTIEENGLCFNKINLSAHKVLCNGTIGSLNYYHFKGPKTGCLAFALANSTRKIQTIQNLQQRHSFCTSFIPPFYNDNYEKGNVLCRPRQAKQSMFSAARLFLKSRIILKGLFTTFKENYSYRHCICIMMRGGIYGEI